MSDYLMTSHVRHINNIAARHQTACDERACAAVQQQQFTTDLAATVMREPTTCVVYPAISEEILRFFSCRGCGMTSRKVAETGIVWVQVNQCLKDEIVCRYLRYCC